MRLTESLRNTHSPSIITEVHDYANFLLKELAQQRNLPKSKHKLAVERYNAVAEWINSAPEGSTLSDVPINFYPIGSFATGTTVRPRGKDEYDLDMAGELQFPHNQVQDPRTIVDVFEERIRANATYDRIAERKTRVIRLHYAGDFYLDFMPCLPDELQNLKDTSIKVPHKETESLYLLMDSNPIGLSLWFKEQSKIVKYIKMALNERKDSIVAPIPRHTYDKKPLLQLLQLLKSARDFYFINDEEGKKQVSSVILQVLLGKCYDGEQNLFISLKDMINRIFNQYYSETNPTILNPINSNEDFAKKWREEPEKLGFKKFKGFIYHVREKLLEIENTNGGYSEMAKPFRELFGENSTKKTFSTLGDAIQKNTETKGSFITGAGTLTASSASNTKVKGHEFYGTK